MKSLLDQIFSLGIGAAVVSKEQIEKAVNELVAKGEVSRKESKDMIDHLVEKGETAKKDLDDMVKSKVQQTLKELNLVTMEEFQELKNRVAKLEGKSE
jgi:polyhydroxyalkanoate synthesis regulator phasin